MRLELDVRALVPRGLREVVPEQVQVLPQCRSWDGITRFLVAPARHGILTVVLARAQQGRADPPRGIRVVAMPQRCGTANGTGWFCPHSLGRPSHMRCIPLGDVRRTLHARSAGRRGVSRLRNKPSTRDSYAGSLCWQQPSLHDRSSGSRGLCDTESHSGNGGGQGLRMSCTGL